MYRHLKKMAVICSILLLVMSVVACSGPTEPEPPEETPPEETPPEEEPALYTPGTYQTEVPGHNAPIKLSVTFSEDEIVSIDIIEHRETEGLADPALKELPERIIQHQSLGVDTMAGATISSVMVINGVADCVDQAGGNSGELRAKAIAVQPGAKIVKTTDVVVVGGGGAGMAAAVSAVENGASVILIEKNAALGGNTLVSGGAWNAANPELSATLPSNGCQ